MRWDVYPERFGASMDLLTRPDLISKDVDPLRKIAKVSVTNRKLEIFSPCDVNQTYLIYPDTTILIIAAGQILKSN